MLVDSYAKKIGILESCAKGESPYAETRNKLDKDMAAIQTAEVDLTPIIESRLYLEKCIQEVDYLLQSSNMVQSPKEKTEAGVTNNELQNNTTNNIAS